MAFSLLATACEPAAGGKLTIGDPAPKLTPTKWVKGGPVDLAAVKDKRIVVVEFWATWCGPCVASVPHLTELQRKYGDKGVTVVGVTKSDERNTLEAVEKFVKEQGDKLGYAVAFDKEGATYAAYMDAAGEDGIPTAFVVDKAGRIAWIGNPMDAMDTALEAMLAGKYDMETARKMAALARRCEEAAMADKWDDVIRIADEWSALAAADGRPLEWKFRAYALGLNQPDKAKAAGEKAVERMKDNADWLNGFAWNLLMTEEDGGPYKALALAAAQRCHEASGGKNWMYLDTLALAKFVTGAAKEAVEIEKKAIKLCDDKRSVPGLEEALKRFEGGEKP
jgi:thiol-disulfide isomerase/thioredoxin